MWILYILAAIALILAAVLLLPIRIIIKSHNGEPQFLFKILFLTFGKEKHSKQKAQKSSATGDFKKALGADSFSFKSIREQIKKNGLKATLTKILTLVTDIIRAAVGLLRHCTVERLELTVVCSGDDAADAAIKYGACCAIIHPLITAIGSIITLKERGTKIDVLCDYSGSAEEKIKYNFVIKVRVFRVLAAFCSFLFKQYQQKNNEPSAPKNIVP